MKSKNLLYPTPNDCRGSNWLCGRRSGRFSGVRWVGIVCVVLTSTASTGWTAPRSSNPAFLGIQMQDQGGRAPCMIEAATRESPAEAAGLRGGDLVVSVDKKPIANCSVLLDEITAHAPGES